MKKAAVFLLAFVLFFSFGASAQTVVFNDHGFFVTFPEGWIHEKTELTAEYAAAGVVDGITAHSGDGIVLWLDVYSTGETFVPAIEMSILEIEGRVSDLREFYPDITYIVAGGVPFICYTAPGEGGEYLMAYTWTASLQINFVFRAPELTDEVRAAIFQILDTYRAL